MPRANTGPRLELRKKAGYRKAVYVIRWYEQGRKCERSTGTGDRREAEEALRDFLAGQDAITDGPRRADQIGVADVLDIYAREHANTVADPVRIGYSILPLLEWWGDQKVAAVRGETCRAYARQRMAGGIATGTARRELGTLRAAINHCHREGYLIDPPVVALPEKSPAREVWLTRRAVAALIRGARREDKASHLPLFVLIGVYTGARKEAVLSLQWQPSVNGGHVDLESCRIAFLASGKAQTKKRRARIPIPSRLLRHLVAARRRTRQYVIEYRGQGIDNIKRAFATAAHSGAKEVAGRAWLLRRRLRAEILSPVERDRLRREFQALRSDSTALRDATPHVLRHTALTWACQRGAEPWDIVGYFGVSMETLQRTYLHHHPDHLSDMAESIGRRV